MVHLSKFDLTRLQLQNQFSEGSANVSVISNIPQQFAETSENWEAS